MEFWKSQTFPHLKRWIELFCIHLIVATLNLKINFQIYSKTSNILQFPTKTSRSGKNLPFCFSNSFLNPNKIPISSLNQSDKHLPAFLFFQTLKNLIYFLFSKNTEAIRWHAMLLFPYFFLSNSKLIFHVIYFSRTCWRSNIFLISSILTIAICACTAESIFCDVLYFSRTFCVFLK